MSALVARPPLHPLEMSAAQRTKRKTTARVNLDEDDLQPVKKKSRVEAESRTTNRDASARPSRRKKQGMLDMRLYNTFDRSIASCHE